MSIEVLLVSDVENLGEIGDVVSVADGYARNYLYPQKLGAPVTDSARRRIEKIRGERDAERTAELDGARERQARLSEIEVVIQAKAGEEGKLYGSVTAAQVANDLREKGFEVEDAAVELEPIKELGEAEARIKLHAEIESSIKVRVVEG